MDSLPVVAALALARAAAGLFVFAWVVWSLKRLHTAVMDVYSNWERWETYPFPDKRAVWNITMILFVVGGWLILTSGIILYVSWVAGLVL